MSITYREQGRNHWRQTGGSAAAFGHPARCRDRRHAAPPLPACIRNRSDGTDTRRAAMGKHPTYKDAGTLSRVFASFEQLPDLGFNRLEWSFERSLSGIEDHEPRRGESVEVQPNRFTHTPLQSIPNHRFAQGARHGKPGLRPVRKLRIAQTESGEERTGVPDAIVIDLSEIAAAKNPAGFRKTESVRCDRDG